MNQEHRKFVRGMLGLDRKSSEAEIPEDIVFLVDMAEENLMRNSKRNNFQREVLVAMVTVYQMLSQPAVVADEDEPETTDGKPKEKKSIWSRASA